jgi:hypothetical protein
MFETIRKIDSKNPPKLYALVGKIEKIQQKGTKWTKLRTTETAN